jgi:hypothetical protein
VFRNRWQDGNDVVVAVALGARPDPGMRLRIWGGGQRFHAYLPHQPGGGKLVESGPDAWTLSWAGGSVAVDFSGKSGAEAVVQVTGIEIHPDPPKDYGPLVEKFDLTGEWAIGEKLPAKQTLRAQHGGEKVTLTGKTPWKSFEGTIDGRTVRGVFNDSIDCSGEVNADASVVYWENGMIWLRMGSEATKPIPYQFQAGDRAKLVQNRPLRSVLTFSDDGQHPTLEP